MRIPETTDKVCWCIPCQAERVYSLKDARLVQKDDEQKVYVCLGCGEVETPLKRLWWDAMRKVGGKGPASYLSLSMMYDRFEKKHLKEYGQKSFDELRIVMKKIYPALW